MDEYWSIVRTVNNVFIFTDQRNWDGLLADVFAEQVLLDYASFGAGQPATLPASQIVANWKSFLSAFPHTHHQLGNVQVTSAGNQASVFCYGTASHYLPNPTNQNLWLVVGSYDFDLEKTGQAWKVTRMKFNFKYQDGNPDLPRLATEATNNA